LGIKFYGSPWQPWFCDWAFNLQRGPEIKAKWDLIPLDTQVLITHGPPLGYGDKTFENELVGCQDLLNAILAIKPRYHICGHIHEGMGISCNEYTTFLNVSSCDPWYSIANPPAVIQYFQQVK
jgi:Icc-related predicted phosphoesterase